MSLNHTYHGNKASTPKSGSADLLKTLGCPLVPLSPIKTHLPTKEDARVVRVLAFQFLLATNYRLSSSLVSGRTKILPFRTIFNILGPLINPARPKGMIVGVTKPWLGPIFARALSAGGVQRALILCGKEKLDKLSCAGETEVWQLDESGTHFILHPQTFGLPTHPLIEMSGGDADENATLFKEVLDPATRGDTIPDRLFPILDFSLINPGAFYWSSRI